MNRLRPPEVHWRLRRVRLSTARRIGVGLATFVLAVVLAAVGGLIAGYTQGLSNPDGQRWMAGIGGLAGAVLGLVGSILVARRDQRRADRRQALAARDSVLMMLRRPAQPRLRERRHVRYGRSTIDGRRGRHRACRGGAAAVARA